MSKSKKATAVAPPASLFKRMSPLMVPATEESLEAALMAAAPANAIERMFKTVEELCTSALADSARIPDSEAHVRRIRDDARLLRAMIRDQDKVCAEAVALQAFDLGKGAMELIMDAVAAGPVRAAQARVPKRVVSDAQLLSAHKTERTQIAAAEKVGYSVRQFRTRLKQLNSVGKRKR